jgi:hypothetical protein
MKMRQPSFALAIGLPVCLMAASAVALSIEPIYHYVVDDAVTGDNEVQGSDGKRRWDVDAGADDHASGIYERPTIQSYEKVDGKYSAEEYFQNVDITQGKLGWDDQFLYVGIELFGPAKSDQGGDSLEGLVYEYGFRFSTDPSGENGFLILSDQPELKHGASFGLESNFAFYGSDLTNGYDKEIVSDGQKKDGPNQGASTLYARVDPANGNRIEFALDYTKLGLSLDDILDLESVDLQAIKGDPQDPQNYPWNETFTAREAGSPFASPGLGAVYELDTLRVHVTPEPSTVAMVGMGCLGLSLFGHRTRPSRRRRGAR